MKRDPQDPRPGEAAFGEPIAIVGRGAVLPGARSLDQFWEILDRGIDTSRSVPEGRWILPSSALLDPAPATPDRVYTDRGCFIEGFQLNPEGLDLPADLLAALDPSVHVALEAGRNAWAQARTASLDPARTGVVLGNIVLPTQASSALCRSVLDPVVDRLAGRPAQLPALGLSALNRYAAGLPAALLARALRLGGGSRALDAACASSLYALKLACDELHANRADAMLAGGLSRPDSLYTQMGFSQLRALARTGRCAPFDAAGSGLVVGEGAGVVVLKRLSDALRDGDRIQALIRGIGLSNDLDGNLLSPAAEGQLRALHQACAQAGWAPSDVDLIECHATGTPVGDAVEFESLLKFWQNDSWRPGQCVLGAVKANIGHLLTGAGSAGLIKILLSLEHRTLPPIPNFNEPARTIPLAGSPFEILRQSRPWAVRDSSTPRRAAINGFGFGGINAHVLIEEWTGTEPVRRKVPSRPHAPVPVAIVGIGAWVGPWTSLAAFQARVFGQGAETPAQRASWRGVPASELPAPADGPAGIAGYYLDDLALPVNRYRIPPKELAELLPQQAVMLEAARAALADAGNPRPESARAGVFIGLGLDLRTTDFHYRWAALAQPGVRDAEASGPPLTADRTMGALAGVSASRIAKEFHFGGPSHTVCCEDASGAAALETAVRALQQGSLDQAVAGAVEITGDIRALRATDVLRPFSRKSEARPFDATADGPVPGEGAVAVVLKRLDDARRDGDRVYAVIRGLGAAGGSDALSTDTCRKALERAYAEAAIDPATVGYLETRGAARPEADAQEARLLDSFFGGTNRKAPCALGSAHADVGHTGAASGLVAVVKASLALYQEILPPLRGLRQPLAELAGSQSLLAPALAQYWIRDRADGPRRAGVTSTSLDGNCFHVVLEACEEQPDPSRASAERSTPLLARTETLFVLGGNDAQELLSRVQSLADEAPRASDLAALARQFAPAGRRPEHVLALIAQDAAQLGRLLGQAAALVREKTPAPSPAEDRDRVFYRPQAARIQGGIAFVFPGAGNQFAGMGRDLALLWPEILRAQDRENQALASQWPSALFWGAQTPAIGTDHRAVIRGQVALGAFTADLAVRLGLQPEAVLGYSLGESTGLFALRAWTARDEMLQRLNRSTLFSEDLTGAPEQLRKAWNLAPNDPVEWQAGLVDRPADQVRQAIAGVPRVYVLIVNTQGECVIGGDAPGVAAVVRQLGCNFFPLQGVSTVHCELLKPVEQPYRELHLFETTPPPDVRFYSGGWGRVYAPDRATAAEAIVAQASDCIDFPRVVQAAYDSGARFFLELGPGSSCSRMIGQILQGRPHWARSICPSAQEPLLAVLRAAASLLAEGVPLNLPALRADPAPEAIAPAEPVLAPVRIPITGPRLMAPAKVVAPPAAAPLAAPAMEDPFETAFFQGMAEAQAATVQAHQAYLEFSNGLFQTLAQAIQNQMGLVAEAGGALPACAPTEQATPAVPAVRLDRAACLEFARGSVAAVLGPDFAPADSYPTRVRLPDEPLMLVDRILAIDGTPRSMTNGRVVTEHDILPGAWYLDCNRIPTCIAVEAGQADLFLSGYLGIDFETRGKAVYRLLDAKVRFHREMPGPGAVIHYDIHIDQFFRQSDTWLFRFHFEATVNGQPLLSMTEGCAGFFTAEALASGRGIVRTAIDLQPMPGKRPDDWEEWVPMAVESYSEAQLEALRAGDLAAALGPRFAGLAVQHPATIPSGLMRLVHRVPLLDPKGGRFGLGLIRGEADIHPSDWFLRCHFVDDRVMPGTLMFECCLHTLRVYLLRLGWVFDAGEVVLEPVPGAQSQLKCRGQVLESTATAAYEVSIKEIGYAPEPYVIADALMYADGKPIVEITNMSLRCSGASREGLRRLWSASRAPVSFVKPALYDTARILAFAVGNPSEAFGAPYRVFDQERRIARLPGPPFQFMDRVTEVSGEPFKMTAGGSAEAQYDIPPDAWYFGDNRQNDMPFAVLLEIALQPCGWLAAYAGSALTSDTDLSFRNLGGAATQHLTVGPDTGTLSAKATLTRVSSSAGMIIQWFDFEVRSAAGIVYKGDTYFGFFPKAALARQEGLQGARLLQTTETGLAPFEFPSAPPYPGGQLRLLDEVTHFLPQGGPAGLGFIRATRKVRPEEWFFKAHFYQDPVVPGSLGLESFLQLLRHLAFQRWGAHGVAVWQTPALERRHEWTYRGQVIPSNQLVTVEATVTALDDASRQITADGFLSVDGRVIYGMKDFTVRQAPPLHP